MHYAPMTEQFKQLARQDFEQLHRFGLIGSAWSTVAGRKNGLLRLEEIKQGKPIGTRNDVGIETVSIGSIAGSESRDGDFDRQWRPLKRANQERWTNIAVAKMTDVPLPAIDLIKVGQAYFVRDGHHRISVAKHRGQLEIEANVTEWHMTEGKKVIDPVVANHQAQQSMMGKFRQAGANSAAKLSTTIEGWRRNANLRGIRSLNRSEKPLNSGTAA